MPLTDREFRQMYESTIRQEERQKVQDKKLDTIHKRLDDGDVKFESHSMKLAELQNSEKRRAWWFRLALTAMSVPGAEWAWGHLSNLFGTGKAHP